MGLFLPPPGKGCKERQQTWLKVRSGGGVSVGWPGSEVRCRWRKLVLSRQRVRLFRNSLKAVGSTVPHTKSPAKHYCPGAPQGL